MVEKYDLAAPQLLGTDTGSFRVLNIVAGGGTLTWSGGDEPLTRGDSLLLPAALSDVTLTPREAMSVVVSYVP